MPTIDQNFIDNSETIRHRRGFVADPGYETSAPGQIQGLIRLLGIERKIKSGLQVELPEPRNLEISKQYTDHHKNKKGLYQFTKDGELPVNIEEAKRKYEALQSLRFSVAKIARDARLHGAHELVRIGINAVKDLRADYNETVGPNCNYIFKGYTVSRWFHDRTIAYHFRFRPDDDSPLFTRWNQFIAAFRDSIRTARQNRHGSNMDTLANKPTNIHLQKSALRLLKKYKTPAENVRSVGIEIECFIPKNSDFTKLYPVAQYVNVGSDGSIHPDGRDMDGIEFRVCAPDYQMEGVVRKLCSILNEMGAKVNTSCGLHVHLDQRGKSMDDVRKTFTNFIRAQNLLLTVVPKSRRRNTFCKKHRGTDLNEAMVGSRYKIVNARAFQTHKTIEIRLFNGTVNADKIVNWVKTLWAIEAGESVLRCPKTFDIATRYWPIDQRVLAWLKARQEKFKEVVAVGDDIIEAEEEN